MLLERKITCDQIECIGMFLKRLYGQIQLITNLYFSGTTIIIAIDQTIGWHRNSEALSSGQEFLEEIKVDSNI